MPRSHPALSFRLLALLVAAPLTALAQPVLLEAESVLGAGDARRDEASASGGAYAFNPRPWNPVVKVPVPADLARLTVWARQRGGPFQLKGHPGGKQQDLKWNYERPANWAWASYGTYTRAQLGDHFILIRGDNVSPDSGLDSLILTDDPAFRPAATPAAPAAPAATTPTASPRPTAPAPAPAAPTASPLLPAGVHHFHAESVLGAGDGRREDPSALGGAYAASPRDWHPVVRVPVPAGPADTLHDLWIRHRGGPFQAKGHAQPGGEQFDLAWNYSKPAAWTWTKLGSYARADLGDQFIVIRGLGLATDAGIDAVVLSSNPAFDPARFDFTKLPSPPPPGGSPPNPNSAPSAASGAGLTELPAASALTAAHHAPDIAADGAQIRSLTDAIRGSALVAGGDYRPLVFATLPPQGDPLNIFVRYRALALQLKAVKDGKQEELPWSWDRKDEAFGWRLVGTYSRAMLGDGLVVISAPNPPAHAGLDAVVITGDPAVRPDGAARLPGMPNAQDAVVANLRPPAPESDAPGETSVSINWGQTAGPVAPMVYGLNSFVAFAPERVASPAWRDGLAHMAPRLVRLHHAQLTTDSAKNWPGWWSVENNSWDYEKIRAALQNWQAPPGTARLFSFSSWLPGMDQDKNNRLDLDKIQAYAAAAAELVRFMNIELRAGIEYFEITNEKDGPYWVTPAKTGEDHTAELVAVYNAVARAVRAVDPAIKIGGPAAMRPDFYDNLRAFVRGAREHLDFVSIHAYASGRNNEPDQSIYDKLATMEKHIRALVAIVRDEFPADRVPEVHLNEYNIAWTWETREPRMVNHKGAVFDALALARFSAIDGLTATNAWNDQDGVYGKIAADGSLRPGAHVFHLFNTWHQGERLAATSDAPERVVVHATRDAGGRPALTLINRVNGEQTVTLGGALIGARFALARIDAAGFVRDERPAPLPARIVLPPHSVTTFHPAAD